MALDIFLYRDTIETWITGSKTSEQLIVCRSAVADLILNRFTGKEKHEVVVDTAAYLTELINQMHAKLSSGIPEAPPRRTVPEFHL